MICFHIASSGARSVLMTVFCLGVPLTELAMLSARALGVRPISEATTDRRSSNPLFTGESRALGENRELLVSLEDGGGAMASVAKKVVTNVYSAVALSINTRRMDRNRASMGSFYDEILESI